jgi:hypothetical protein
MRVHFHCPSCNVKVDIPIPKLPYDYKVQDVVLDENKMKEWDDFIETLGT